MAQATQSRHGDAAVRPHAQGVQRFPDSDPGAEQRSGSGRIQTGGKRMGEPVADDVLAGVAPQGGRSVVPVGAAVGQGREGVAGVLLAGPAHRALPAGIDDVADRDRVTDGEAGDGGPGFGHHARELVPRHQGTAPFAVVAADGVQIGVADTAAVRLPASCCPHCASP